MAWNGCLRAFRVTILLVVLAAPFTWCEAEEEEGQCGSGEEGSCPDQELLQRLWEAELTKESPVLNLTDSDFDQHTKEKQESWVLNFYAPWCPHSKKWSPIFEQTARWFRFTRSAINFAQINSVKAKQLVGRFGVSSWPTVIFYANHSAITMPGAKSVATLTHFITGGFNVTSHKLHLNITNKEEAEEQLVVKFVPSPFEYEVMQKWARLEGGVKRVFGFSIWWLVGTMALIAVAICSLFGWLALCLRVVVEDEADEGESSVEKKRKGEETEEKRRREGMKLLEKDKVNERLRKRRAKKKKQTSTAE
ncbi:hypothetical protein QOT17_000160 [Balamuthia mandrillaris]